MIAQQLGFSIDEIRQRLEKLPDKRTPTRKDWERISSGFRKDQDQRSGLMTRMRDRLDGCIGCSCLSLENCQLYNPQDRARRLGSGPRFVLTELASLAPQTGNGEG